MAIDLFAVFLSLWQRYIYAYIILFTVLLFLLCKYIILWTPSNQDMLGTGLVRRVSSFQGSNVQKYGI